MNFCKRLKGFLSTTPQEIYARGKHAISKETLPYQFKKHEDKLEQLRVSDDVFTSSYALRAHGRANWIGCDPRLMVFYSRLYDRMRAMGFPIYCHTAYRSPQLQAKLKADGYSNVTSGAHQRGAAVDIVHLNYHWNAPTEFFELLGVTGMRVASSEGIPMRWGGDWDGDGISVLRDADERFWDPAHFELKDWRSMPEIRVDGEKHYTPRMIRKMMLPKIRSEESA
jgi:hypothetical protein